MSYMDPEKAAALRVQQRHDINDAPVALNGCCCETIHEIMRPRRQSKLWQWIAVAAGIVAGIAISRGVWGAERFNPGLHEIVLLLPPDENELDPDNRRNQFTLSDEKPSRAICEKAKERLVVKYEGGRLVCLPVEMRRVQ